MKAKSLLIGIGAPLIFGGAASASVSTVVIGKDITGNEDFVSAAWNVYVIFDGSDPATNFLTGVGSGPGGEAAIVTIFNGVFYQNFLGGRTAPNQGFIPRLSAGHFRRERG